MTSFRLENIAEGNAIAISVTGMLIVFSGLLLISFYIAFLPKVLAFIDQLFEGKKGAKSDETPVVTERVEERDESDDNDIASVISLVLHLEQERLTKTDYEQITIARSGNQPSVWSTAGKMRNSPLRRTNA